ncbi:MAG: DUF1513 domain-containing protein [Bdellovibrionota bacterium]
MRSLLSKLGFFPPAPKNYFLLSASRKLKESGGCQFSIFEPSTETVSYVDIPLRLAHSVVGHPGRRRSALAMDQYGKEMCEVDLLDRAVHRVVEAGNGRSFYGHGAFSPDAKLFISTEISSDTKEEGFLVIRDGKDFTPLEILPSHGRRPHDLVFLKDGKTLLVANQGAAHTEENGEPTCLTFIDLATGKLVRKLEESQVGFLFSHLAANSLGNIAVGLFNPRAKQDEESKRIRGLLENPETRVEGAKRSVETLDFQPAPIFFVEEELEKHAPESIFPDMRMTLSLCMHRSKAVLGAIHVMSGLVTFTDAHSKSLLSSHRIEGVPQGIALTEDGTAFVVSTMDNSLFYFDANDFRILKKIQPKNFEFGHHMLAWQVS